MSKIIGNNLELVGIKDINAIPVDQLGGGSGGEAQSYITTGRSAESVADLNAWTGYNNTPGVNPTSGISGTATGLSLARNTTNQLSGLGDFHLTKDGVNRQGQGISTSFTVDNRHLARVLQITFDLEVISGIVAEDDIRVSIVGDPNVSPFILEPVGTSIEFPAIGNRSKHLATFQTDFTIKTYRLCIHIASTTPEAFTVAFNNFRIWEQEQNYGAIITDWQEYTPIFSGFGSITNINFKRRRVGSNIEIEGLFRSGTTTVDEARITLPNGLLSFIGTTATQSYRPVGIATRDNSTTTGNMNLVINNSVNYLNFTMFRSDVSNNPYDILTGNSFNNDSDVFIKASVPIAGWGSNMALSSDAGSGRQVFMHAYGGSGGDVSVFPFSNKIKDTHNAFNTSTGEYTIPHSGWYRGSVYLFYTSTVIRGIHFRTIIESNTNNSFMGTTNGRDPSNSTFIGSLIRYFNAGDKVVISTDTAFTSGSDSWFTLESVGSGSQILARDEVVACSYYSSANQIALTTQINFAEEVYDTHNAVTTGLNAWKFTAPKSSKYLITGTITTNGNALFSLFKDDSINSKSFAYTPDGIGNPSHTIELLKGEWIDIRPIDAITVYGEMAPFTGNLNTAIQITSIG